MGNLLPIAVGLGIALFACLLMRELVPVALRRWFGDTVDYAIVALLAAVLLALAELVGVVAP